MRRDFEGGVYWNQLPCRCGEISRAAGLRRAARFRGNTVLEYFSDYLASGETSYWEVCAQYQDEMGDSDKLRTSKDIQDKVRRMSKNPEVIKRL